MTITNVDDLLIKLAKTTTHTYDVYPIDKDVNININCLELNNSLLLIFIGSGIGWFFISDKILNLIKKYCCKKNINLTSENSLVLASHVI